MKPILTPGTDLRILWSTWRPRHKIQWNTDDSSTQYSVAHCCSL